MIELDGPGVTPKTVDAALLLRLSSAVVEAVVKVREAEGHPTIPIAGISVEDKCVSLVLGLPAGPQGLDDNVESIDQMLRGARPAPRGAVTAINSLRGTLRKVPRDQSARVLVGASTFHLQSPQSGEAEAVSWMSFRGELFKVGGHKPRAYLTSRFQEKVTLEVSKDQVLKLRHHVYDELDVRARVVFDGDFRIVSGRLESFVPVDASRDSFAELKRWFAVASPADTAPEEETS